MVKGLGCDRHGFIPSLLPSEAHIFYWCGRWSDLRGVDCFDFIVNHRKFYPSATLRLTVAIIGLRAHGTNRLASGLAMEVSCEIVGHLCSLRALAEPALFIKIDGRHHMDELVPSLEKYAAFARAGYAMAHRYSTG